MATVKNSATETARAFVQKMQEKGYVSRETDQLSAFVAKKIRSMRPTNQKTKTEKSA